MDLVGRLLRLGVFYVAQQFTAIAQCGAVRLRRRCLRLHYRDLNLGAILSYEVSASVPLERWHCKDATLILKLKQFLTVLGLRTRTLFTGGLYATTGLHI